jgi:dihydrofolate reductase
MNVSIIVAKSSNNVIGINNTLPWHLPADLKRFKAITMGHHMIMGRKTYESIGKPLPGRTSIIITRQKSYQQPDCIVVNSIEEAIQVAKNNKDTEAFIIGGAEIILSTLNIANKIYLTEIHQEFKGDTFLPTLAPNKWSVLKREDHSSDEKNPHNYSFIDLVKA